MYNTQLPERIFIVPAVLQTTTTIITNIITYNCTESHISDIILGSPSIPGARVLVPAATWSALRHSPGEGSCLFRSSWPLAAIRARRRSSGVERAMKRRTLQYQNGCRYGLSMRHVKGGASNAFGVTCRSTTGFRNTCTDHKDTGWTQANIGT